MCAVRESLGVQSGPTTCGVDWVHEKSLKGCPSSAPALAQCARRATHRDGALGTPATGATTTATTSFARAVERRIATGSVGARAGGAI